MYTELKQCYCYAMQQWDNLKYLQINFMQSKYASLLVWYSSLLKKPWGFYFRA